MQHFEENVARTRLFLSGCRDRIRCGTPLTPELALQLAETGLCLLRALEAAEADRRRREGITNVVVEYAR